MELGSSHEESLPAQILFLKHHRYVVHVLVSADIGRRNPPVAGADVVRVLPPDHGGWRERRRALGAVRDHLRTGGIRKVVFNTVEGARVRDFCLSAPRGLELTGIINNGHRPIRKRPSLNQWVLDRRFRGYFVLADYILRTLRRHRYRRRVESFFPIFFPGMPDLPGPPAEGEARSRFTVCIPGRPRFAARDYDGLLGALGSARLNERVRFVFPADFRGQDGPEIRRRFAEAGLADRATFFEEFLDFPALLREVARSDVVLPLLHPSVPWYEQYRTTRITGTMSLALAVKTPMMLHRGYEGIEEFRNGSVFYEEPELVGELNRLAEDREELRRRRRALAADRRFDFEVQARRYVDFIEGRPANS